MKKMKKVFAVLLTLAMVLGMSITTFADEAPKISITLPEGAEGATITYEKIVEPDPTSADGWKFVEGYTAEALGISIGELLAAGGDTNAEDGTINQTEKLGAALEKVTIPGENKVEASGSNATISPVTAGLYVIEAQKEGWTFTRMLAYVAYQQANGSYVVDQNGTPQLVGETKVSAKGAKDQVKKELADDAGQSVTEKDTVSYKVTQSYPFYDADQTNKAFTIVDELSKGKFAEKLNVTVTIKGAGENNEDKLLSAETEYKLAKDSDTQFTLTLGGDYYNAEYAGKQVEITYDVIVDKTTTTDPLTNSVSSTISDPEGNAQTTFYRIISPSVKAEITKTDETDNTLADAEFTLYVEADLDEATHIYTPNTTTGKNGTIAEIGDTEELEEGQVPLIAVTAATTEDTGIATFEGLDAQKDYYVVETKAPDGYSLNTTAYKLVMPEITSEERIDDTTVEGETWHITEYKVDSDKVTLEGRSDKTIADTKLSSLPSTGGIGTTIFTIGGCAIIVVAAGLFFASRRKSAK